MGSTSLVSLVVELVENLAQQVAHLADVGLVVVFAYVVMRHGPHVAVQPVDGDVDAVERPPAEEPGDGHGDVEEYLVVHHSANLFWLSGAKALRLAARVFGPWMPDDTGRGALKRSSSAASTSSI